MHINHYECDECGVRVRRITVHASELPGHAEDLHFCGTLCMHDFIESDTYWLSGQDIRDGA